MSELLREVARHLRQEGSLNRTDPLGVIVLTLNQDGTADSFFMGDQEHASMAAQMLPGVANDFVQQITGAGFPCLEPAPDNSEDSTKLWSHSLTIHAERIAAQAIKKARQ